MDVTALKLLAADRRREVDRLVKLYEAFQNYVEQLARVRKGELTEDVFRRTQYEYQLRLDAEQGRFLEWHDGDQLLHTEIFTLVRSPEECCDIDVFKAYVARSAAKFLHLIGEAREKLAAVHEELAIVGGEEQAAAVTTLEPSNPGSAAERVKVADEYMETGFKWAGRVVSGAAWVLKVFGWFS
jgi:hypothetical protein